MRYTSERENSDDRDDYGDDDDSIADFEGALSPSKVEGSTYFIEGSYSNFDLTWALKYLALSVSKK